MQRPSRSLPDPRFTTAYAGEYKGPLFHQQNNIYLPASVMERWCEPGYRQKRPDKGIYLTVNDYQYNPIQYGGGLWPNVVYTPFKSDN
jgi:hypothetical protein